MNEWSQSRKDLFKFSFLCQDYDIDQGKILRKILYRRSIEQNFLRFDFLSRWKEIEISKK